MRDHINILNSHRVKYLRNLDSTLNSTTTTESGSQSEDTPVLIILITAAFVIVLLLLLYAFASDIQVMWYDFKSYLEKRWKHKQESSEFERKMSIRSIAKYNLDDLRNYLVKERGQVPISVSNCHFPPPFERME